MPLQVFCPADLRRLEGIFMGTVRGPPRLWHRVPLGLLFKPTHLPAIANHGCLSLLTPSRLTLSWLSMRETCRGLTSLGRAAARRAPATNVGKAFLILCHGDDGVAG